MDLVEYNYTEHFMVTLFGDATALSAILVSMNLRMDLRMKKRQVRHFEYAPGK